MTPEFNWYTWQSHTSLKDFFVWVCFFLFGHLMEKKFDILKVIRQAVNED